MPSIPLYTFTSFSDPNATDGTVPDDINDSGQIVGHYTAPTTTSMASSTTWARAATSP